MTRLLKLGFFLALLAISRNAPVAAQTDTEDFYQQWIDYQDGEISVAFEQTPVQFALQAIQARTGFQIVVPSSSAAKLVSLRLNRQPLEPAVRSLISTIGYTNFAVMYDETGQPRRAVVLGAQPLQSESSAPDTEAAASPISLEERDRIKKDLARWNELKHEERSRIEERLKNSPQSEDREQLLKEYGRQLLAASK